MKNSVAKEKKKTCANCGKIDTDAKVCANCKTVHYCSAQCQRNHWQKDHKNHSVLVSAVILRKEGALEPFASLNDCPFKHDPEGQGRNKRKK